MKITLITMLVGIFLLSCGEGQTRDEDKTAESQSNQEDPNESDDLFTSEESITDEQIIQDEELAGETVSYQIDEAISSIADDATYDSGSSSLALNGFEAQAKRFRRCTESGDTAVVEVKKGFSRSWEAGVARKISVEIRHGNELTRTWSKADSVIKCKENGKSALVPVMEMEGVELDIKFKREKYLAKSFTNLKGVTKSRTLSATAEGVRHFKIDSITQSEEENSPYLIKRTHTKNVERKIQVTGKDGKERILSNSVATGEEAPLKVEVERDSTTLAALSRTIESGTVIATNKSGGHMDTTFSNVKWDKHECMPASGSITGAFYKAGEEEAAFTYEVTFDGNTKSIVFSDGREYEYTPEGCDLDEPETFEEAESADEVNATASEDDATEVNAPEEAATTEQ